MNRFGVGSLGAFIVSVALITPTSALANPPTLISVGQTARHPVVQFSAPEADFVNVSIATSPEQATDGSFLEENVVDGDALSDSEIQAGQWEDDTQLDPGDYWVLITADADFSRCEDFDTGDLNPNCADGTSTVLPLVIPTPNIRYSGSVPSVTKFLHEVDVRLTAKPLGLKEPYRVCFNWQANKRAKYKQKCLNGTLDGYDWNSSADDDLTVKTTGLAKRTAFIWYVKGKRVAAHTATGL